MVERKKNKNGGSKPKARKAVPMAGPKQSSSRRTQKTALGGVPISRGFSLSPSFDIKRGRRPGDVIITGQDYLQLISILTVSAQSYQNVANIVINPNEPAFEGTRLQKFGYLYDKFVFRKLRFHIVSSYPSTTTGSYITAYDRDMADQTPPQNEVGMKSYFGNMGAKMTSIWQDQTVNADLSDTQDFYYTNYTGYEGRLSAQGQLYVALVQAPSVNGNLTIWCEYEIEFMDPQNELPSQVEDKLSAPGVYTPSAAGHAGLNGLTTEVKIGSTISSGVDDSGNTYVNFATPGSYFIETLYQVATNAANNLVMDIHANLPNAAAAISLLSYYPTIATANSAGALMHKITVPAGGAKVYGAWSAAVSLSSAVFRAFPVLSQVV